jgi:hypothetical protein
MDFQFGDLVEERDSLADVLDRLCGSVGAWWGFDRLSVFRVIELTPPSGVPVCTLSATEIISCTHSLTSDVDQGIPVSKIRVKYEQKRRLLTNEEVHPLSGTSSAALTREYSEAELSNNTVIDAYPNAGTLEKVTQITGHYSDIGVYAARLRDIYTARRYRYDLKMRATASVLATVDLGAVVNVVYPRFGMSSGRLFRVIGIEFDLAARMIDLVLWR